MNHHTEEEIIQNVKSGLYFKEARRWYRDKYIYPFSQRSFIMILCIVISIVFLETVIHIYAMFPTTTQVKYSIKAKNFDSKAARIIKADNKSQDPILSITDIMLRNYIEHRESYDYDKIKSQMLYVKNTSTRVIFRRFYNFVNIDNPSSPILRFGKNVKRHVTILAVNYKGNNRAQIKFLAQAKQSTKKILENSIYLAEVDYEIDKLNLNAKSDSRFDFAVTNYNIKLLEDKQKK